MEFTSISFFVVCADQFKWKSVIKAVLRQAPDQELPIKRLRKKVHPYEKPKSKYDKFHNYYNTLNL